MAEIKRGYDPVLADIKRLERTMGHPEDDLLYVVTPIENTGFILKSPNAPAGTDIIAFDCDETLVGYGAGHGERDKRLIAYSRDTLGLDVPEDQLRHMIVSTHRFSNWNTVGQDNGYYQANVHLTALTWAFRHLAGWPHIFSQAPVDFSTVNTYVDSTLKRIKLQLEDIDTKQEGDPFSINPHSRKLALGRPMAMRPWNEDLEAIFEDTVLRPPRFEPFVEAAKLLAVDSQLSARLVIFTHGDPVYQYNKVANLQAEYGFDADQIWLTKTGKGDFLQALTNAGELPDGQNRALVLVDDNPKQLDNFAQANNMLHRQDIALASVRAILPGTKEAAVLWDGNTGHNEINLVSHNLDAQAIAARVLENRYRVLQQHYGNSASTLAAWEDYCRYANKSDGISPID